MKVVLLAITYSFIALGITAQGRIDTTLFKGANKIQIVTGRPAADNYKAILNLLIDNGYSIAKRDNELGTIRTELKRLPYSVSELIDVICRDNQVVMTAKFDNNVVMGVVKRVESTSSMRTAVHKGTDISDYRIAFSDMNTLAKKAGGQGWYVKE